MGITGHTGTYRCRLRASWALSMITGRAGAIRAVALPGRRARRRATGPGGRPQAASRERARTTWLGARRGRGRHDRGQSGCLHTGECSASAGRINGTSVSPTSSLQKILETFFLVEDKCCYSALFFQDLFDFIACTAESLTVVTYGPRVMSAHRGQGHAPPACAGPHAPAPQPCRPPLHPARPVASANTAGAG